MVRPRRAAPVWSTSVIRVPIAVLALLSLGVLLVMGATVRVDWSVPSRAVTRTPTPSPTPTPVVEPTWTGVDFGDLPGLGPALAVVMAAIVLALVVLLGWRLWLLRPRWGKHAQGPGPQVQIASVSAAADVEALQRGAVVALSLLDEVAEPRDAVLRSWMALERAAKSSGAARQPADSPTEFARGVLAATGADPEAVQTLLRLYHSARFSRHPMGSAQVQEARACVLALSRSLSEYRSAFERGLESDRGGLTDRTTRPPEESR